MNFRTRFAPSPTGTLHLGSVRTALYCWLYVKHHGGQFILRIEDTDRERSTRDNVNAILDALAWLGLDADEGPYYQSEQFDRYKEVIDKWLAEGKAYHCYCTREELEILRNEQMQRGEKTRYDGRCRHRAETPGNARPVVRFKNPLDGLVVVDDLIRGQVVFDNKELDDLVIARSDGTPTYNFSVVVDDYDMKISHVIRGDDHLNNTPKQMNMLRALDAEIPAYAHIPMILGPDGGKLSKRHGAVDIREYRELGYLPEAMLNYIVRLGWSHGNKEIFAVDEMIELFDILDVNQSASTFNPDKLLWVNQQHIISLPRQRLGRELSKFLQKQGLDPSAGPSPEDVAEAYRERADTLLKMAISARYCYEDFEAFDPKAVKKYLRPVIVEPLRAIRRRFSDLTDWTKAEIARCIDEVAAEFQLGFGKLGQPLRVAATGGPVSPPIDITIWLVGQDRMLRRLNRAIEIAEARHS